MDELRFSPYQKVNKPKGTLSLSVSCSHKDKKQPQATTNLIVVLFTSTVPLAISNVSLQKKNSSKTTWKTLAKMLFSACTSDYISGNTNSRGVAHCFHLLYQHQSSCLDEWCFDLSPVIHTNPMPTWFTSDRFLLLWQQTNWPLRGLMLPENFSS